ncbi:MAG: heme exporter protein CcmB [Actinomycetota bacterium]
MIRTAMLVAAKDLRIELRSRVLLWQVVPFGVMALMLTGLAMGPNSQNAANLAPGMFYLVLLFVVILTVSRAFAIESPVGTSQSTKMLGLDPAGVFLGKASAIFLQLLLVGSVLLLGAATLLHIAAGVVLHALPSVVLALGGLAITGTLYGALTSGISGTTTLLPVLALPAFAPLLIAGERAFTSVALHQSGLRWLLLLILVPVVYTAVGILLYGVVEE